MKFISGGREFECPVHVCTGYRATGMRLDERDLDDLARMNPVQLVKTVRQLANRTKHRQPSQDEGQENLRMFRAPLSDFL